MCVWSAVALFGCWQLWWPLRNCTLLCATCSLLQQLHFLFLSLYYWCDSDNNNNVTTRRKLFKRVTELRRSKRKKTCKHVNTRIKVSLVCPTHSCCCESHKYVLKYNRLIGEQYNSLFWVYWVLTCDTSGIRVCSTERVLISRPESKLLLLHGDEAIPAEQPLPAWHNAR